jgi:hypothetical protein
MSTLISFCEGLKKIQNQGWYRKRLRPMRMREAPAFLGAALAP